MRRLLLLLVACSPLIYAVSRSDPNAPKDPPRAAKCERSVVREYEFQPDEPRRPAVRSKYELTEGGMTLDEKAELASKEAPSAGVCDARRRDAVEDAIVKQRAPAPAIKAPIAWDGKKPLAFRELVRDSLALTPEEEARLVRDGFVVPARLEYPDYTQAYYDIHRSQLPVFVTADSILHAIYASHDQLLARLEKQYLARRLDSALGAMHCGLVAAQNDYPKAVVADLDLYLTVARSLLAGELKTGQLGADAEPLVTLIEAASGKETIALFGRKRSFDASQYAPRGHYVDDTELERYFRAAMWLSRAEFNIVSRDTRSSQPGYIPDPSETPHEAVLALALADLAQRTGAMKDIAAVDRAWTALAGRREDIPLARLLELRKRAGIKSLLAPDAPAKLRAAIGDQFKRTVNTHPNPNVPRLPAIAALIGPRVTPDVTALGTLTNERGDKFQSVEVGFMLGHDRAKQYFKPTDQHRAARDQLAKAQLGDDLYSSWLTAIRTLADRPQGTVPSFMDKPAFADMRMNTALAAFGQLKHDHVLIGAQTYDQGGCEIPDGYVEPALDTYRALAQFAGRGEVIYRDLDPKDTTRGRGYYKRLGEVMDVLVAISREQLANKPLSATAKRFLAMIVERREAIAHGYNGSFPIATFDGWYIDMFPSQEIAIKTPAFVADFFTYDRDGKQGIHYLGAKAPRLGVFVVDTGGAPRVMVGPVAHAFGFHTPLTRRLTDDDAPSLAGIEPWSASYTQPAPAAAVFTAELHRAAKQPRRGRVRAKIEPNVLRVEAAKDIGVVTVDLLDHHFVTMKSLAIKVAAGRTDTRIPDVARPVEAIRFRAGKWSDRLVLDLDGTGYATFGGAKPLAPSRDDDFAGED